MLEVYTVGASTSTREADIQRNPLGIYVRTYEWQEVL
jgi:type IV secretory pathway TrbF-like protein